MGGIHEANEQVNQARDDVKKLFVLLLLFAAASATIPALRERVEPRVVPVWDSGLRRLDPVIDWAKVPIDRWAAQHEAEAIARMVRSRAQMSNSLPLPSEFKDYLRRNWRGGKQGLDPWGNWYYLVVTRDSITVGSAGPDGERNTEDDIRASVERR